MAKGTMGPANSLRLLLFTDLSSQESRELQLFMPVPGGRS